MIKFESVSEHKSNNSLFYFLNFSEWINQIKKYKILIVFLLTEFLINIYQLFSIEITPKEIYYFIAYSQNIKWSYLEMPPLLGLTLKLGVFIFGKTTLGIRFFNLLACLLLKICLIKLIKTQSDKISQNNFILFVLSCALLNLGSLYISEYILLLLFYTLFLLCYKKITTTNFNLTDCILCSLSLIGLLYSSYFGAIFYVCILLFSKKALYKTHYAFCIIISLLSFVPVINWLIVYKNEVWEYANLNNITLLQPITILKNWGLIFLLTGPVLWANSNYNFLKILKSKNSYLQLNALVFIVNLTIICIAYSVFKLPLMMLYIFVIPMWLLAYDNLIYVEKFKSLLKISIIFSIIVIVLFRGLIRNNELLIKTTKENLLKKDLLFLNELFPNSNVNFINSNQLASIYEFYNNKKVFNIETFQTKISEYQFHHLPFISLHKQITLITTKKNILSNADTIFFKGQNLYYKNINEFIYWKDCFVKTVIIKNKNSDSIQYEIVMEKPVYITDEDIKKISPAIMLYNQPFFATSLRLDIHSILKVSNNEYKIVTKNISLNTIKKMLPHMQKIKINISFLQDGDCFYINSNPLAFKEIGL